MESIICSVWYEIRSYLRPNDIMIMRQVAKLFKMCWADKVYTKKENTFEVGFKPYLCTPFSEVSEIKEGLVIRNNRNSFKVLTKITLNTEDLRNLSGIDDKYFVFESAFLKDSEGYTCEAKCWNVFVIKDTLNSFIFCQWECRTDKDLIKAIFNCNVFHPSFHSSISIYENSSKTGYRLELISKVGIKYKISSIVKEW